ncbi:MAG: sporulation protein YabP [Clostridia bacterium]|nr:sporulation protein YabP [Clostridia bacterium]
MAEKGMEQEKKHTLAIEHRARMTVTGVTEVQSFDEQEVELTTDCGALTLEGEGLHVGTLDIGRGVVEVTGHVTGCYYSENTPSRRGLRGRFSR